MSLTDGIRKGMVIRHEGHLFTILDFQVAQAGKQRPTVHVKLREFNSKKASERTLEQLGTLREVPTAVRTMTYLYAADKDRVFMDTESFEQYTFDRDFLGHGIDFLTEDEPYRFQVVEGQPVAMQIPDVTVMAVAETAPVEHAGGGGHVHKEATLTSGLMIQVPLFIKTGDKIRVRTESAEYVGKEH